MHTGAVVAASNAALALVQLGDEPAAIKEMQKALRRAPGSADLRAALAALYWSQVCSAWILRLGVYRPVLKENKWCKIGAGSRTCKARHSQEYGRASRDSAQLLKLDLCMRQPADLVGNVRLIRDVKATLSHIRIVPSSCTARGAGKGGSSRVRMEFCLRQDLSRLQQIHRPRLAISYPQVHCCTPLLLLRFRAAASYVKPVPTCMA